MAIDLTPKILRISTAALFLAASLALSACGGGGGGSTMSMIDGGTGNDPMPMPTSPVEPPAMPPMELSRESGVNTLGRAAISTPRIGRRGVTQSHNVDSNNVTTDNAEAVFERGQITLRITKQDSSTFELNSRRDALEFTAGNSLRDNQIAHNWQLQRELADDTTINAGGFGEIPARQFPLRAIHASGNWGTNWIPVRDWNANGRNQPLIPPDHIAFLESLNVNWVGLSVALHYDDSTDSTVERVYSDDVKVPTFADDVLIQFIREFKDRGIDVYLTLAFEASEAEASARPVHRWQLGDPGHPETGVPPDDPAVVGHILPSNWPWRPDHPDHQRFVAEFWKTYTEQAVHFARIAEAEGVGLFSLGTEVERLFRTRSGGYFTNHFGEELETLVSRVREVYSGMLTYDMHYSALTSAHFFGSGSEHLWDDLDLDVVGVSAWFPLAESEPSRVLSVEELQERYENIFQEYLIPLAKRNSDRPVVFLEYGATDNVGTPASPAGHSTHFGPFEFSDKDGNGLDDGQETQANVYQALLNTIAKYPGVLEGIFWWDNWISSDAEWAAFPGSQRGFPIRDKLSGDVVRSTYESWADWLTGGYWMQVNEAMEVIESGAFVDGPELAGSPTFPSFGTAKYEGFATGGYAAEYSTGQSEATPKTHELGAYRGDAQLTADFGAHQISGRVHAVYVDGFKTSPGGVTDRFTDISVPYVFDLGATSFDKEGFTGHVTVTSADQAVEIATSDGSWGGKFSTVPDDTGYPRIVAGTHGATLTTMEGTQASFIGAFVGSMAGYIQSSYDLQTSALQTN